MAKLSGITTPSLTFDEGAAASTPAANKVVLYAKSDGLLYSKDDAGAETVVTGGGGGGGISSGTSFPGGPSTNDLYYRTDRAILYYYDGTRWLSVNEFAQPVSLADANTPIASNGNAGRFAVWTNDYDQYLTKLRWTSLVNTTNTGSAYWNVAIIKVDGGSASTITTPTTSADAADVYVTHATSLNMLLGTSYDVVKLDLSKTGSPGSIYFHAMLCYRLVG